MSDLHEIVHSDDPNWPWRCSCGEEFRTSRKHALHVREALLADPTLLAALAPLVTDRERAAEAERDEERRYLDVMRRKWGQRSNELGDLRQRLAEAEAERDALAARLTAAETELDALAAGDVDR